MNKITKVLTIGLFISIFSVTTIFGDIKSIENKNSMASTIPFPISSSTTEADEGFNYGYVNGKLDGYTAGSYAYSTGKTSSAKISDSYSTSYNNSLINFKIREHTTPYKEFYSKGYEKGFKIGFNNGLKGLSLNDDVSSVSTISETTSSPGADEAYKVSSKEGAAQGKLDYYNGKTSDPYGSYTRYISEKSLNDRFTLYRLGPAFQKDFESAFKTNYISFYIEAFSNSNFLNSYNVFSYNRIDMLGSNFKFSQNIEQVGTFQNISSSGSSSYNYIYFDIPEGAVAGVGDAFLGLQKSSHKLNYPTDKFNYVNNEFFLDFYTTINQVKSAGIKFSKPYTISLDYIGSDDVGIYQFKNGTWNYIFTEFGDKKVSHTFPAGTYTNGEYALLLEPNFKTFTDISLNWAYQQLYTYARRGYLYGNEKLYPESNISRGEFCYILNKILNPNNDYVEPVKDFEDANNFGAYTNAINFVVSKGYMGGTSQTKFNSGAGITYDQVNIVLNRVTNNNFSMSSLLNKMKNEKYHFSKGLKNRARPISKSEATYAIFSVFEK